MSHNADVIVIGGGPAGLTAAISTRRLHPNKKVLLIRDVETSLIPCGIPYMYGTFNSIEKNIIPDKVLEMNDVRLLIGHVDDIDHEGQILSLSDGSSCAYEKLILATGSKPFNVPIPGRDLDNVIFVTKDKDELSKLRSSIEATKDIVIIGGGFIGVEMADEINKMTDANITIAEMFPRLLINAFDETESKEIEEILAKSGITVRTGSKVWKIKGEGAVESIKFAKGDVIPADLVIIGAGMVPETSLAEKLKMPKNLFGGILVDDHQKTLAPNIFAVGDCCAKISYFDGEQANIMLASVGAYEARVAAMNLYSEGPINPGAIGAFSTIVGGKVYSSVGLTQANAMNMEIPTLSSEFKDSDRHPSAMPGANPTKVRLVFQDDGLLLGGMVSGGTSAGEAINVLASCIQAGRTIQQIAMMQVGTHPAVTASPVTYPIINAAQIGLTKLDACV